MRIQTVDALNRLVSRPKSTSSSVTFSGNNNRIDGYSYDAAGNLLSDGVHTYTYDAENRIISVDSGAATYVYDADGQRVRKTVGGASTDYLYDLAGHAITEVNASGWQRGEVYAGGRHVATYAKNTTYFAHMDWLGTERVHTAVSGAVCETVKSLPFGDGESATGSCDPSTRHFTGKMRDAETNLDNFEARYYSSALGRFMIPDWDAKATAVPYAAYGNPQTLNLYGYVGNNPITETDATGHAGESPSIPVSQAEPLDVTGQDNAHWEPQVDIDPELGGSSMIGAFIDQDNSGDPLTVLAADAGISLAAVGNTQAQHQVTVLGRSVAISYASGLSASDQLAVSNAIVAAVGLINKNAGALTADEKKAIGEISSFSVVGPNSLIGGTGAHGMTLSVGYIKASSAAWLGSLFGHEGQHHLNAGKYSGANLWRDEQSAGRTQLGIGGKIGFTAGETRYLEQWIDDKNRAAMQRHMEQGYVY